MYKRLSLPVQALKRNVDSKGAIMVVQFKVFKKASPNGKITLYMGRRDFVDHVSSVDPVGKYCLNREK